ncbi:hypothetical protein BHE90_014529 [Fusarium euwallaceae]|uniref:Uncharacterized protein n=2 Tax=Fusarium solani species complex TaxID=232080 RepID=A0A430L5R0_9HYPO|nr:hypothetical protein CEP51_014024 [Fusarium floridanum]RTE71066.1 hypothetical protein BHE90_014529 [Fusarium euwallaceae]
MGMATRAIYADDPSSPPRAIEPPMQVAANYRYHRDPCILIGEGYHGVHRSIKPQHRGVEKLTDLDPLGHGDLLRIKTPLNLTGEARNLGYYVAKARQAGAYISVDATLGPPHL